jgi:hypothetical protein
MRWTPRFDSDYEMRDLDLFLAKLADCFKPTQEPYRRIVLGREGVDELRPVIYSPPWRGILRRFEVPSCDRCEELVEMPAVTLSDACQSVFFEPAMVICNQDGHEWLCGEVE